MSEASAIEWTDSTFNPWIGCTKVGPGCDNCYAEALMAQRYGKVQWGAGAPRVRTGAEYWHHPVAWNRRTFYECLDCGRRFSPPRKDGFVTCQACGKFGGKMVSDEDDASRVKQVRRRVFCASLADVFDNEVDDAWRMDLFALIGKTPNLDWLVLTKRVGNVRSYCQRDSLAFDLIESGRVWIGATVVNQEEVNRDVPKLLAVPARVRFLSVEPMLGPISFEGMWVPHADVRVHENMLERLSWVIVGGESGHNARPMHPDWARSLRDQCQAVGVPFLFKQWGEWAPHMGSVDERPLARDITFQKLDGGEVVNLIGKKRAGRLLDGREWNGFPA